MNNPAASGSEMTGQPVRSLQYMLNQLAIHNPKLIRLTVDGIFGERTLEAVMVFQREYHPPVTGVVDLGTWNAIRDAYFKAEQQYGFPPPLNVLPCGTYTAVEGQECPPVLIVQAMFVSLSKVMSNFSPCKLSSCAGPLHLGLSGAALPGPCHPRLIDRQIILVFPAGIGYNISCADT